MNPAAQTQPRSGPELLAAIGLYLALLGLAFGPKWLAGHAFLTEVIWDPVPVYLQYPADLAAIQSLAAGQLPIWDPSRGFGTSSFVPIFFTFTQVLKIPVYILHSPWAWECYLLLRLLLAGVSTFLLARALPIRFPAALTAGAAYMFCGYFREFINFQHLNLEAFFPLLLWCFLTLARRPTLRMMLLTLLTMYQIPAGGNPTAHAYGFLLGAGFCVFLAALPTRGSSRPLMPAGRWLGLNLPVWILGLLWSGHLLVGVEFSGQAWNLRLPEIARLHVSLSNLVALVTPLFDYWLSALPPSRETRLALLNFVPAYLGVIVSALALLAVLHPARLPRVGLFFILGLPFALGLVFGIPPFNLLGRLPILYYSQNFRYVQSLPALFAALAAGMGLNLFLAPRSPLQPRTLLAILAGLAAWVGWHLGVFRHWVLASPLLPRLGLGVALSLAAIILIVLAARFILQVKSRRSLSALALAATAIAELLLYFLLAAPLYGPQAFSNAEPPAAAWLRAQPGVFRLLGTEPEALHPNLAGIYGLEDVRDSTPIYLRRYLKLLAAINGLPNPDAILANYFEKGRFYVDLQLDRIPPRLQDLMNVRYIISRKALDRKPLVLADPQSRRLLPIAEAPYIVPLEAATLAGKHRSSLLTHAPSRAEFILSDLRLATLATEVGILPEAGNYSNTDGAWVIALYQAQEKFLLGFCRFLNPRLYPGEQEWLSVQSHIPADAPLLHLLALPGPRNDRRNDFVVWGEPGQLRPGPEDRLALVYDQDLRIYENRTVLPRAFWAEGSEWLESDEEVLKRVLAKDFDPEQVALIHSRPPGPQRLSPSGPATVELSERRFGRAGIRVQAQGSGFLVLTDLYYPGWEARVDGRPARIYPVNLAFRGVPLSPGEHQVVFRFRPAGVRIAVWIMAACLGFIPLALIFKKFSSPDK